jgi:AcrR family transcriptional regulator
VPDVAAAAGVSVRTVYRHFASREELIAAAADWISEQFLNTPFPRIVGEFAANWAAGAKSFDHHPNLVRAMVISRTGNMVRSARRTAGWRPCGRHFAGCVATYTDEVIHDVIGSPTGPVQGPLAARGFYQMLTQDIKTEKMDVRHAWYGSDFCTLRGGSTSLTRTLADYASQPGPVEKDRGGSRRSCEGFPRYAGSLARGGMSNMPGLIDPDSMLGSRRVPGWRGDDSETRFASGSCPPADRGAPQAGLIGLEYGRLDLRPAGILGTGRPVRAYTEHRAAGYGRRGNGNLPDRRSWWPGPLHQAASRGWAVEFAWPVLRPPNAVMAPRKQPVCARPSAGSLHGRQPFRCLPGPGR